MPVVRMSTQSGGYAQWVRIPWVLEAVGKRALGRVAACCCFCCFLLLLLPAVTAVAAASAASAADSGV
jgi:hypothetical protein